MGSDAPDDKRFVRQAPVPSHKRAGEVEPRHAQPSDASDTGQPDEQVAGVTEEDLENVRRRNRHRRSEEAFRDETGANSPTRKAPPRH